jgi:hypothetical protein
VLCFKLPKVIKQVVPPKVAKLLPATLCAILLVSIACYLIPNCDAEKLGEVGEEDDEVCVEKTKLGATLDGFDDLVKLVQQQFPSMADVQIEGVFWPALRFALQLAPLAYLDTLLTCLVVDKMVQEQEKSQRQTPKVRKTPSWPRSWANFSLF